MKRSGVLLAFAAAGLSGVAVFVNSYGVHAVPDATVYTTAKNSVAGLVLLALAGARSARGARPLRVPRTTGQWLGLGAVAVVGGSVPFVLFFEGLARIESGPVQAQFLNKTLVIWVTLLAVTVLRERVGWPQWAAVAVLICGQVVLSGGVSGLARLTIGRGELMILGATLLWAVEVVVAKTLLPPLGSATVSLARMVLGSGVLVGWLAVTGRLGALARLDLVQWRWALVTGALLAAYVATWFAALARASAVTVTAVLVAAIPVTAVLQAVVRSVPLAPQADGLLLVLAGSVLVLLPATHRRVPEPVRGDR